MADIRHCGARSPRSTVELLRTRRSLRTRPRTYSLRKIPYVDGNELHSSGPPPDYERPAENDHRDDCENKMKVIIVGAGEVGSTIAGSLSGSHDVIVIDSDPKRVDTLTYNLDVLSVFGDGTDAEIIREAGVQDADLFIREAGVQDADLFIASTDSDETNLVACGTANALGSPFTIARVKHPRFLSTWQHQEGAFGVDYMVCTDLLTARAIVGVIGLPTARAVDTFADGAVQAAEFEIPAASPRGCPGGGVRDSCCQPSFRSNDC